MGKILRFLPCLSAASILVVASVVHGLWTDRWGSTEAMAATAAKLPDVPTHFGEWLGTIGEMDPRVLARTGGLAAIMPTYENQRTGEIVHVLLLYGRPGPVSQHTPDVCYAGAGYTPVSTPVHRNAASPHADAQFWCGTFVKPNTNDREAILRILWSWSGDGSWSAPDNPKIAFARYQAICKLYVIRPMITESDAIEDDPCNAFISQFLPELNRTLFDSQ
jgi:hypothetical protein